MKLIRSNKVILGVFIALFIVSLFFNYVYYQDSQAKKERFSWFVQEFALEIYRSTNLLQTLINEPKGEKVVDNVVELSQQLNKLDFMLNRVYRLVRHDTDPFGFSTDLGYLSGIIRGGTVYGDHYIAPFNQDGVLNSRELSLLTALNRDFNSILAELISEEEKSFLKVESSAVPHFRAIIEKYNYYGYANSLLDKYLEAGE